ncbi:MAG: response regulator transcription factor [Chloroflexales bacterium]|nr:response regulator transcription factor [Chloroflexales bacterium]
MIPDTQVLVVEDDDQTRTLLASVLADAGYHVSVAADATAAIALVTTTMIDVVLSDIRLREESGITVLEAARARPLPPEVILLTGYASIETTIAALRAEAFDYLQKPVATGDLLDTVRRAAQQRRAALRRAAAIQVLMADLEQAAAVPHSGETTQRTPGPESGRYQRVGQLQIDILRRIVTLGGLALHLTPIEYALVSCLAETPGRVVTSSALVRRTHGYEAPADEAQVLLRGHIRNLRCKIPKDYLVTVRGNGYMLVVPE